MSNPFFDHPILNSPYEYPMRHWELDFSGQPTQQVKDSRRRAEFITPIPKPKKRKRAQVSQGELVLDEGKGISTKGQQYDLTSIIKKGEHGSILSGPKGLFIAPAYPLRKVVDPTGAGDSFVGGLIGYLAAQKSGSIETNLRRAILHGSVVASFCCEGFGLNVTTRTTKAQILARVKELEKLSRF
jgi:bifunctional ADP-heptose synthase (sugar kinase/adenylyltransferase)